MYTFITGCLRHFLCHAHTPLHPSVTSSQRDRLFSFIRTRPWFDSDITQRAFPFTASNALCLLMHVLTPSIHAAAIIRFCCVIIRFCCVIRHECVLWSPCSPGCLCPYLAHLVTTIASARPEFFQLMQILLPGLMYGRAIKSI